MRAIAAVYTARRPAYFAIVIFRRVYSRREYRSRFIRALLLLLLPSPPLLLLLLPI